MRQLFPNPVDHVDVASAYAGDERPRSPWLLVNMISSLDGATAVAGKSGALGGPADKRVFAAIRSLADFILVGAGTVRAENYGPPTTDARLVMVSGSLDLDPKARVFSGPRRPVVVTTKEARDTRGGDLERVADLWAFAPDSIDLHAVLDKMTGVVVCEGGPSLNGQLIALDLVDELCLTLSPVVAAGGSSRVARGPDLEPPSVMQLTRILEEDGLLFLRYVRSR